MSEMKPQGFTRMGRGFVGKIHPRSVGLSEMRSQLERVKHERELWKEVVERRQQQPLQCLGMQHYICDGLWIKLARKSR